MTRSAWDDIEGEATRGKAFVIPPGLHLATIIDVSEPVTQLVAAQFAKTPGEIQTRFHVDWELEVTDEVPPGTVKWHWMNIPPLYFSHGEIHPKSWVWRVMAAIGYDMGGDGPWHLAPRDWISKSAQLFFKPSETDPAETVIGDVLGIKPVSPARQPVAAGRTGPQARRQPPPVREDEWNTEPPPEED